MWEENSEEPREDIIKKVAVQLVDDADIHSHKWIIGKLLNVSQSPEMEQLHMNQTELHELRKELVLIKRVMIGVGAMFGGVEGLKLVLELVF